MKKIASYIFIAVFIALLVIPVVTFNYEKNAVSDIDNKVLTENPFESEEPVEDIASAAELYVSERIGFRDDMILGYTVVNDVLFSEMVHPTYMYGKDGYVFFNPQKPHEYRKFDDLFVEMLCDIQKYCDERGIPFVFVFEPSKASVYKDKLPDGYKYDNSWVDTFIKKLDENNINYADNLDEMIRLSEDGVPVFNVKYNAGHWNDTGAFYGMNNALEKLKKYDDRVHVNTIDEFDIEQKLNTTLPVSRFPIHEYEPIYHLKDDDITDITASYRDELKIDYQNRHFAYYINEKRREEGSPRALVFQGSYIIDMGYKFLQNSFGEYIAVHDYQNVMNFDYYMNIFEPDCIIFDAAEYTFSNKFFDPGPMKSFRLNPLPEEFDDYEVKKTECNLDVKTGESLTTVNVVLPDQNVDYGYMMIDGKEYDMHKIFMDEARTKKGFTATVKTERYRTAESIEYVFIETDSRTKYLALP